MVNPSRFNYLFDSNDVNTNISRPPNKVITMFVGHGHNVVGHHRSLPAIA